MSEDGDDLETHYRHVLETLGKRSGMLGVIFRKAQNKIQDPAKLRRLIVDLIDKEQWSSLAAAHDYIAKQTLDRAQKKRLKSGTLHGIELVDSVARLCCMNLLLHGIGG